MCLKAKDKVYRFDNLTINEYDQKFIMVLLYTRIRKQKQALNVDKEKDTDSFLELSKEMSEILELISLDTVS